MSTIDHESALVGDSVAPRRSQSANSSQGQVSTPSDALFADPSIILVGSDKPTSAATTHTLSIAKEPANALSQLLDSAILNAAKESSPELDAKITSSATSPRRRNASDSPKTVDAAFVFTAHKTDIQHLYTIEQLLDLRNFVDTQIAEELPAKEFWGMKPQKQQYVRKEFTKHKKPFKKDHDRRKKDHEEWDQAGDADWVADELSESLKLEMGDTVEDFERWKQAQRRKNGPPVDVNEAPAAPKSNEVDNFFSFVKPKASTEDQSKTNEATAKSSRFSSFFGAPGVSPNPPQPQEQRLEEDQGSSRFFGLANDRKQGPRRSIGEPQFPSPQKQQQNHNPPPGLQGPPPPGLQGPPPGLQGPPPGFQGPPPGLQGPPPGLQGPAPGAHGPQGGMRGPPGMFPPGLEHNSGNPNSNDSFFMSLLSRPPPQGQPPKQTLNQQSAQRIPPWFNNSQPQQAKGGPNPNHQQPGGIPQDVIPPYPFMNGPPPPGMFPPGIPPQHMMGNPNMQQMMPPPNQQYMQYGPGMNPHQAKQPQPQGSKNNL